MIETAVAAAMASEKGITTEERSFKGHNAHQEARIRLRDPEKVIHFVPTEEDTAIAASFDANLVSASIQGETRSIS